MLETLALEDVSEPFKMLQALANADLERLVQLASVIDNCTMPLAVFSHVVSAACPEQAETVEFISEVHAEDGQQARSAMRDVAAAAMFDIIRRHDHSGWALAFPLRDCVVLPSARANEMMHCTSASYGCRKHVPCGVTAMDFMGSSALGVVVQALASTRAWAAEQGLLRRAEHGSPTGDGLVLAGGCVHNALQPAAQRLSVVQADADVFVVGAVSAAAGARMAAHFLEGLAHRVEVVQGSMLVTECSVGALYMIPPGFADTGRGLRVQVCLRPYFSTFHVLNSFDLCACKVAALPSGAIVAHPRFVYGCARGRVQMVLPCHRQATTSARIAKYWTHGWLCEGYDNTEEDLQHQHAGAMDLSMGGNVVVVRPTACSTSDLLQVALPLMSLWEAASDAEWRRGNVAMNVMHAMTGAMMQLPHVKWAHMKFRPNTQVAAGVQVERPLGCASAVSVPDGILWSDQTNPSLPASMAEVQSLRTRCRLLKKLQVNLDAAKTRVMVTPVLGRVPVKQGDLAAVQVRLHDITGPTPVVVCGTAPTLKRTAEVALGKVQAGVAKPALSGQQVTLLFAKVEVDDPTIVDEVRSKITTLDVGQLWSKLSRHKAAGSAMHKVDMAGHAYIATDSTNIAGWYVQQGDYVEDAVGLGNNARREASGEVAQQRAKVVMARRWASAALTELRPQFDANEGFEAPLPAGCSAAGCNSLGDQVRQDLFPHLRATAASARGSLVFVCDCHDGPSSGGQACTGRLVLDWQGCKVVAAAHSCSCAAKTRPNTQVAAGVQVERPLGCASAVSVPDGILWSDQTNPSLPASMAEVQSLRTRCRLLKKLQVNLDAAKTRVMVTPVLGRVPVKQGDLAAVQVRLHDITGPTPVVVCGTAPTLKRTAEVALGKVQAGVAKPALSGQQVTLLFAKVEVDDPTIVDEVRSKITTLDVGQLWSKLSRHKAAGSAMHKVDMAGHAYIATDSTNIAGWYVQQGDYVEDAVGLGNNARRVR
ncbi:hypothetical protein VOLCADRAFT_100294 [Volvox carteri f. nagariensis]|uniref:Uncharacterized protein n=1 Tax=Volvox carteri f. nagariensis TaxID=3068 RepID=D8UJX8_VOLCA|nr:uncharacterized protein VOLCADRAFT_100294 [Volvox carteri f. nagariensis]EFJ39966.1 hypothetical protein VOLCADRAFT_100294 [Volvox carteri f. nagariensis]|eukprot:XP_002958961.1 hypothetical protein VOLCADRAFT_100294 [Volvox carteri f. nagariensis]